MSPSLRRYILVRILLTIPMILILISVVFFVMRVLPGDPALARTAGRRIRRTN